ncbi:TniQ family protein [Devosia sp. Leaf64]|uniref:TniQ family protein n=1 Tax=Devosia sp. Leaf64 TaxID=1736229 RepID=UPI00138ED408|nr:TniQ family protein [Devosia sp. Leaf64]
MGVRAELHSGQTLNSFVCALASRTGLERIDRFCRAFGLNRRSLIAGDPTAIAALSALCAVPLRELLGARTRNGPKYLLAANLIAFDDRSPTVRMCPDCLREDALRIPGDPMYMTGWQRASWCHRLVHVCVHHQKRLIALPLVAGVPAEDFAVHLGQFNTPDDLPIAVRVPSSPTDEYLTNRLSGAETRWTFLDSMTLPDALFLSQYLCGTYRPRSWPLPPEDSAERRALMDQGIEIALAGEAAVAERLREISRAANPDNVTEIGLRRVFGPLFQRLDRLARNDMLAVRQMVVAIGTEQRIMPSQQTEVLGLPVPGEGRLTVAQAVIRFGVAEAELRAILIDQKVISEVGEDVPADELSFNVFPVADLLSKLRRSLHNEKAAKALGIHHYHLDALCNAGLIAPLFSRQGPAAELIRYFERATLKAFISRLRQHCTPATGDTGLLDIWHSSVRCGLPWTAILNAALEGKIALFSAEATVFTLGDILVDPKHLEPFTASADVLLTLEDAARILTINPTSMRKILREGFLPSEAWIDPATNRDVRGIRESALKTFAALYVSQNALRKQLDSSSPGIARVLRRTGVRPAFDQDRIGVSLYRRKDISRVQGRILQVLSDIDLRTGKKRARRTVSL